MITFMQEMQGSLATTAEIPNESVSHTNHQIH